MTHSDCAICAQQPPDELTIFRVGSWSLSIPSGQAPWVGWVTVHPIAHRSSPDELTLEETSELGALIVSASRFLRARTGAERIYVANWAEATPHVHFHLIPRSPDLAAEFHAAKVFALMSSDRTTWPDVPEQLDVLRELAMSLNAKDDS